MYAHFAFLQHLKQLVAFVITTHITTLLVEELRKEDVFVRLAP
jgi:hypothetical protein